MGEWVRYLGIDYGEARIGLAVSDDLGMLAHPLETVAAADREAAIQRIVEVVEEREIQKLVVGLPLRMDGSEGSAAEKVRKFNQQLGAALKREIPIVESDERLTTVMAMEKLHAAGRTEKNSRDRIDQAAAVEILQEYLDIEGGGGGLTGPDDPWAGEADDEWEKG